MVKAGRQRLEMVEHLGAQGEEDGLAHLGHEHELRVVGGEHDHGHAQEDQGEHVEARGVPLVDVGVDTQEYHEGDGDVTGGVDEDSPEGHEDIALVWPHIGHEARDHGVVICLPFHTLVGEAIHGGSAHPVAFQAAHAAHHPPKGAAEAASAHLAVSSVISRQRHALGSGFCRQSGVQKGLLLGPEL